MMRLKHEPQMLVSEFGQSALVSADLRPCDSQHARIGSKQSANYLKESRLAGTRSANHRHHFPTLHCEIHIFQNLQLAIRLANIFRLDYHNSQRYAKIFWIIK